MGRLASGGMGNTKSRLNSLNASMGEWMRWRCGGDTGDLDGVDGAASEDMDDGESCWMEKRRLVEGA